jgi:hypothetical protein
MCPSRFALSIALFVIASPFAVAADAQHNSAIQSPIDFRALRAQAIHAAPGGAQPGELFANPDRAYPPSCLNAPLANQLYKTDPHAQQKQITLPGDPITSDANEYSYTEADTVTVFRVPCAGGVSAVLVEIDRPSTATSYPYPVFPGVAIGSGQFVPRIAADPNTFYSNVYAYDPVSTSSTYVFENVYGGGSDQLYNQALSVFVYDLQTPTPTEFDLPAYNPSDYAAASQPMPISGYQSGNFYDATRGGEGIQIEVGDTGTASSTRTITFAWYTFDSSGTPYWLYGNASFTTGATQVNIPLYYGAGGGFAGNYTSVDFEPWGNITSLEFTDCNTVRFSYASNAGLPAGVPAGSGSKIWTRLTQLNGLTCQ